MDQLPHLGKRELICLLLFTCNYVVSVGEVSSSSGCLGWATLFYCDTTLAFHIIILKGDLDDVNADSIIKELWISVWSPSNCCKNDLSKQRYITLNATIPGQDRIYPKTLVCRTYLC